MASGKQLTFYTAVYSPYSHRVQLALDEANAAYKAHYFDNSRTKPEWYYQINPIGKIPSIVYGGPDVPPDQPSPEAAKLVESLPLIEFIAEIHPDAALLPSDPVLRAKARIFISMYENYVQTPFREAFFLGKNIDSFLQAIEKLQGALPPTGFAVGQYSLADIAVAPFLVRMMLFLNEGLGGYSEEDFKKLQEALGSEKYARFRQYIEDIKERPSFKKSWDEAAQIDLWKNHPGLLCRATAAAAEALGPKSQ